MKKQHQTKLWMARIGLVLFLARIAPGSTRRCDPCDPCDPCALAAPVEEGMMFWEAHRPPRQSCRTSARKLRVGERAGQLGVGCFGDLRLRSFLSLEVYMNIKKKRNKEHRPHCLGKRTSKCCRRNQRLPKNAKKIKRLYIVNLIQCVCFCVRELLQNCLHALVSGQSRLLGAVRILAATTACLASPNSSRRLPSLVLATTRGAIHRELCRSHGLRRRASGVLWSDVDLDASVCLRSLKIVGSGKTKTTNKTAGMVRPPSYGRLKYRLE